MTTPVGVQATLEEGIATALNAGWMTREDASLKVLLSGIKVPTNMAQRDPDPSHTERDRGATDGPVKTIGSGVKNVPVYFRFPQVESRAQVFPFITIDYLTTVFDGQRAMQGHWNYGQTQNAYTPAGLPAGGGKATLPIPMNLHYQVSTWTRSNEHDRLINTTLLTTRILPRYGGIDMVGDPAHGVPDDFSTRRLDLLSGPTNGDTRDKEGKRVFRKMYTISISSEMFEHDFARMNLARTLILTVQQADSVNFPGHS